MAGATWRAQFSSDQVGDHRGVRASLGGDELSNRINSSDLDKYIPLKGRYQREFLIGVGSGGL